MDKRETPNPERLSGLLTQPLNAVTVGRAVHINRDVNILDELHRRYGAES